MAFLNRQRELGYLDGRYGRGRAAIAVIYGRRRVGKTALLYEWTRGKRHVFFFGRREDSATALRRFSRQLREVTAPDEEVAADFTYADWETAFQMMGELARDERLIVVMDEYSNLAQSVPGISSILQEAWDMFLQHTQLFLVLTGSLLSVMRRQALDVDAPLYRRHTWPFELKPLTLYDLPDFFPNYDSTSLVEVFSILGGVPYYLISVDPERGLLDNIDREILTPSGALFDEPRLQLHRDLRGDIENYLKVLSAIADGAHRRADIVRQSGIGNYETVGWVLSTMVELGLLEHRRPVGRLRARRRWGMYHIRDPFFAFWSHWVTPQRELLEIGQGRRELLDQIRQQMAHIVAPVWESVAQVHLLVASGRRQIPFVIQEAGPWWSRDAQIDIVGVNRSERRVIFAEAKWLRDRVTRVYLERLIGRAQQWLEGDTGWDVHYALFVREVGDSLQEIADAESDVHIFTPNDMLARGALSPSAGRLRTEG